MLIIDEDEFLKEIKSERFIQSPTNGSPTESLEENKIPSEVVMENTTYDNFRKPEGPNVPKPVKALIGALAGEYSQKEVHEAFPSISLPTIANASNDNHKSSEVKESKEAILDRIKANSLKRIEECIDFLDISKSTKNTELITVASGLSNIIEKITPKAEKEASPVQFIFYAPERQNSVQDYDIVEADK